MRQIYIKLAAYNLLMTLMCACLCLLIYIRRQSARQNICEQLHNKPFGGLMDDYVILSQEDPCLIQEIRQNYLFPPSKLEYNLKSKKDDFSDGQSKIVYDILGNEYVHKGGFFVEVGAFDGEFLSTTLLFEKKYGWNGLLIEGSPQNFQKLQSKNRKAWSSPTCLSNTNYPMRVQFEENNIKPVRSRIGIDLKTESKTTVQCVPFFSLLTALNVSTIDFFSLDVEGLELEVLRNIPWNKVNIKVLAVEYVHIPEGEMALRSFMNDKGYEVVKKLKSQYAVDLIFSKNSFSDNEKKQ